MPSYFNPMRRLTAAALLGALGLAAFASTASADLIYDNRANAANGGTLTTTGSTPRNYMADGINTLAPPSALHAWEVQSMGWQLYVLGSGVSGEPVTYNNVSMRLRVYNDWDSAATGSVFSNPASDVVWNLGNITNNSATGGAQAFTFTLNYASNNLAFELVDGQSMGVAFEILVGGAATTSMATIIRGGGFDPVIGSSTNGWYRDADADGIIESTDFRTLGAPNNPSHLAFSIDALAITIPEPASAGLALGGLLLLARRRRA